LRRRPPNWWRAAVCSTASTVSADPGQEAHRHALEALLLGGKPIREPVFQYGPFVMNTKMELIQALEDYNDGKFGAIPPAALMPHRV